MLTTIEQFAGKDIWVYAELEYEDAYIRVEKVFDNGTVWYNAWLPSDSYSKYDIDEILYGELTGDVDSIEIHPLDTLTTAELIAKIKADGKVSGCSKVTSSRKFTKYPQGYVKANDIYKVSDNPTVYTNLNFGDMYSELDKDYATTPNAKGFIAKSIDEHYYKWHLITKAEADALRAKYLGD